MNLLMLFLALTAVIVPHQAVVAAGQPEPATITITADQVTGAMDIEMAINVATANGTRPGTVILDGSKGSFNLSTDDRSINIFVSDLTLRGVNNAMITGCDDGLFFDDFPLKNILVEEITFKCFGDGIDAPVSYTDVTIRNNLFQVKGTGILVGRAASDWMIANNDIQAGDNGIWIHSGQDMTLFNNRMATNMTGILLQAAGKIQARHNTIFAKTQGVFLEEEAWDNVVQGNSILGVSVAGIVLANDSMGNRILVNKVLCATGAECQTVSADSAAYESNKIAGNKP